MAEQYAYAYAAIDLEDNMCIGVETSTDPNGHEGTNGALVPIPVYDEEYIFKYYIDGNWYEDAAGTIPWTSSLI